jgi:hypothetical protein
VAQQQPAFLAGLVLTAVLSANVSGPNGIALPGIWFALYLSTYKIGFPGWPEPNLDSVTGFGASIEKKGACTSPLFYFPRPFRAKPQVVVSQKCPRVALVRETRAFFVTQKSERPLGGTAARAWGWRVLTTTSSVCPQLGVPSIARRVHSVQYFPLPVRRAFLVRKYLRLHTSSTMVRFTFLIFASSRL